MSKTTQNSASGIKDVKPTETTQGISQAAADFAMTLALNKTEWKKIEGVTPILFTLKDKKSGRMIGGVLFVSPNNDIVADDQKYTFLFNGEDIDDLVPKYATLAVAEGAIPQEAEAE